MLPFFVVLIIHPCHHHPPFPFPHSTYRYLEFQLAWFADPVWYGKYPDSMVELVGDRLPIFTPEEADLVKGSWDFFALNHVSMYAS